MTPNHEPNELRHPVTGVPMDAAFQEILKCFIDELPNRIRSLEDAMDRLDITTVRTVAHQLRGCAAGYGFPELGEQAGVLEKSLRETEGETDQLNQIRGEVDGLVALCRSYCHRT